MPISSRYDVLPPRQLLGRLAERRVFPGVAGHRPEQVAIELRDETGERRAPSVGQPGFAHVLSGRLRCVEAQRFPLVELEHEREEPMPECFGVAAGAGQLVGVGEVRRGICDQARPNGRFGVARPGGRTYDPPHDVPHVHQQGDERDDDQRQTDVEGDRMLRREAIEPLDEVMPLPRQPGQQTPVLDPLILGPREDLPDNLPERVGRDLKDFVQCIPAPSCSLST